MGYGDNLMASGLAKGAHARGKRIAFGDGQKIIWDHNSEPIFKGNPNIAKPGSEGDADIEWIAHHRGNRLYNHQSGDKWVWNYKFKATPGELFFDEAENKFTDGLNSGFIIVEASLPEFKTCAPNKQWPKDRYLRVAHALKQRGHDVRQFYYPGCWQIPGVPFIKTPSFRHAAAALRRASLYIGPEGGMHHAAAAMGTQAVVLFGGFIPPQVTGYDFHTNLTGGAEACGSLKKCQHCIDAMNRITVEEVEAAALAHLDRKAA